jgi:predicted GTPase
MFTVCVAGGCGTGKSSTLEALFGARPTTAPTRAVTTVDLPSVRLVDAPGLGEETARDRALLPGLARAISRSDLVLWILSSRNRALAADFAYLDTLAVPHDRLVFGVNQVDLAEPVDWNTALGLPSEAQEHTILELLEDRRARLAVGLGDARPVVGYSATRAYRLQELFTELVSAVPPDRASALRAAKALRVAPMARLDREVRRERMHQKRERILRRKQ